MSEINLVARKREEFSELTLNQMRKKGMIPGIYYGNGVERLNIAANELDLRPVIYTTESNIVNLKVQDNSYSCILKDVQFHPLSDKPVHFDLIALKEGEMITIEVNIHLVGNAVGIKEGGVLQHILHKLELECLPKFIPSHIDVDVSGLNINDSIKVSDAELYDYYSNKNAIADSSLMEVNILEILTDSLDVVESVMSELAKGTDFRALASIHTKRVWTKNNGGEFGFFPVTMYGDIGRIAAAMKIGEIYGPIKLPEGYSIFKLIDKKDLEIDSTLTYEQAKGEIRKNLAYKKSADFFIDYTVKLANKFGVAVNEQIFNSISVSDQNMFVYRYMGFGGRINAVPMAIPFSEWFLPWKESKKLIP